MRERWREINNYAGFYEVSNTGKVRSLNRSVIRSDGKEKNFKGVVLKPSRDRDGYCQVSLSIKNKATTYKVHRLVAMAFIGNKSTKLEVNHKNGIKHDNIVSNLEWVTHCENIKHAFSTGLISHRGRRHPWAKLTDSQVKYIRSSNKKQIELARDFELNPKSIRQILSRVTYKEYL
jgi:ribosomal 50S subunit-recycling heat shock protein